MAKISLYGDPKPFCDTCHGSLEIQFSKGVTVTAQDYTMVHSACKVHGFLPSGVLSPPSCTFFPQMSVQ